MIFIKFKSKRLKNEKKKMKATKKKKLRMIQA